MWIVQNGALVRMADDAPLPPGSRAVNVPDDFVAAPDAYKLEGDRLVPVPEKERPSRSKAGEALKLTQEEIRILKAAIKDGRLERRKSSR
jgi:hypothetical protein